MERAIRGATEASAGQGVIKKNSKKVNLRKGALSMTEGKEKFEEDF